MPFIRDKKQTGFIRDKRQSSKAPAGTDWLSLAGRRTDAFAGLTPEQKKIVKPIANDVFFTGAAMMAPMATVPAAIKGGVGLAKVANRIKPFITPALREMGIGSLYGGLTSKQKTAKGVAGDVGLGGLYGLAAPIAGKLIQEGGEVLVPRIGGWGAGIRKEVTDYTRKNFPEMYAVSKSKTGAILDKSKELYKDISNALSKTRDVLGSKVSQTMGKKPIDVSAAVKVMDDEILKFSKYVQTDDVKTVVEKLKKLKRQYIPEATERAMDAIDEQIKVYNNAISKMSQTDKRKASLLNEVNNLVVEKKNMSSSAYIFPGDEVLFKKQTLGNYAKYDKKTGIGQSLPDGTVLSKVEADVANRAYKELNNAIDIQLPKNKVARKAFEDLSNDLEPLKDKIKSSSDFYKFGASAGERGTAQNTLDRAVIDRISDVIPESNLKNNLLYPEGIERIMSKRLPDFSTFNPYSVLARMPGVATTTALGAGIGSISGDTGKGALVGFAAGLPITSQLGVRNAIRLGRKMGNMSPKFSRLGLPFAKQDNPYKE